MPETDPSKNYGGLTLEICRPCEEHARQVMNWRNDPQTLSMFYHNDPKVWETFWPEFRDEYFKFSHLPPLFVRNSGDRVAFIRFLPCRSPVGCGLAVDVSLNVAPAHRGRGHGAAAIRLAVEFLGCDTDFDTVVAEVRKKNVASHKTFLAAGFRKLDDTHHTVPETGEQCPIGRYIFDLTPPFWTRSKVFIIAEAGSNWRMGTAKRDIVMGRALVDVAAEAGADAVKFQTYRPETVYVENAGSSDYLAAAGETDDIRDIFADLAMPYDLIPMLAEYSASRGVAFMSTPFSLHDFAAIDPFVKVHKVASYEISHPHLVDASARSGKPLVMSTGAATPDDISWAVDRFRASGGRDLCLMQCTARYPAPLSSLNLRSMIFLKRRFRAAVGFSDHSRDPLAGPVAAVALGARVIEKHFTLDNRLPGPDHAFAVTPGELATLVRSVRAAELTLGDGVKGVLPEEEELRAFAQRRIQATKRIEKGATMREGENIAVLRPGHQKPGAHPRFLAAIDGATATRDIPLGDGVQVGDWA
jgi:sialic acid synthase SpsE/RimJ/RimL family protein N-acetyltransferase